MRVAMLLHKSVVHDSRVRREAAALAAAGHDVVVLELAAVPVGEERLDGFRRRCVLPPAWVKARLPAPLYRLGFLAWFVAGVRAERPNVIHAHDAAMLLPAMVARRLFGGRIVYDTHELATSVPYRERAWAAFVSGIERLVLPRCAAVIAVSDGIADVLQRRYRLRRRPVVLRNVSDLEPTGRDMGLRAGLGISEDAFVVLHQGAPAPSRGCDVIVSALALSDEDVHLVFLGDAEDGYGRTLRSLIAASGLEHRVHLTPAVALEELLDHTAEADVGMTLLQDTCLNHRLALPNKLFEYLAAGLPVIGADLPEVRALVERHGVGWTASPTDPSAVAAAIDSARTNRGDPELAERVDSAHAGLRWAVESERLLSLYRALPE